MRETIASVGPIKPIALFPIKTKLKNNIIFTNILNFLNIIYTQNDAFSINEKFLVNKYGFNIDFDEDKILNSIYSQLVEFRKLFNLYLQTFVVPLYEKYNSNDHLSQIFRNINFYFTFNYTPTFEKLYDIKDISVNYLHGKSEFQKENIVFEISELFNEEYHKSEYIKFTKYFQRFNNRTDFYFLN